MATCRNNAPVQRQRAADRPLQPIVSRPLQSFVVDAAWLLVVGQHPPDMEAVLNHSEPVGERHEYLPALR